MVQNRCLNILPIEQREISESEYYIIHISLSVLDPGWFSKRSQPINESFSFYRKFEKLSKYREVCTKAEIS